MAKSKRNNFRRKSRKIQNKRNRKTKRAYKKINRTNRRRGGMSGIAQKDESQAPKEAFEFFIDNSKIKYLSRGSFGTTFIATLDDGIESPYKSTDAETYGQPVSSILIKLATIENPAFPSLLGRRKVAEDNFNREVDIQKEIYFKTMEYLEPACPAIVYSNVYKEEKEKRVFYNKFRKGIDKIYNVNYGKKDEKGQPMKHKYRYKNEKEEYYLIDALEDLLYSNKHFNGVIGMEFATGYKTLASFSKDTNFKLYEEMLLFLLLEVALKTGYSHADFHKSNLMVNNISTTYFVQTEPSEPKIIGKPLLIDFGLTNKIPPELMTLIKEHYDREEYTKALHYLCDVKRSDDLNLKKYPYQYGWVCGSVYRNMTEEEFEKEMEDRVKQKLLEKPDKKKSELQNEVLNEMNDISNMRFQPDTNDMIKLLFKQRQEAIKQLVVSFNPEHTGGIQLPLNSQGKEAVIEVIKTPKTPNSLNISSDRNSRPVDLDFLDNGSLSSNKSSSEGIFAMSPY